MYSKMNIDRPGIEVVRDEQLLNSIGGGTDVGDAVLEAFHVSKWIVLIVAAVRGFNYYGDPANRTAVRDYCIQTVRGVNAAGRDLVFGGISGATELSSWITTYFSRRANQADETFYDAEQGCPLVP